MCGHDRRPCWHQNAAVAGLITTIVGFALIGLDMLMAGCTLLVLSLGRLVRFFRPRLPHLSRRQIKGAGKKSDLARCWRCCWTAGDRCRVGGGFTRDHACNCQLNMFLLMLWQAGHVASCFLFDNMLRLLHYLSLEVVDI